jgi:hypothetical protein
MDDVLLAIRYLCDMPIADNARMSQRAVALALFAQSRAHGVGKEGPRHEVLPASRSRSRASPRHSLTLTLALTLHFTSLVEVRGEPFPSVALSAPAHAGGAWGLPERDAKKVSTPSRVIAPTLIRSASNSSSFGGAVGGGIGVMRPGSIASSSSSSSSSSAAQLRGSDRPAAAADANAAKDDRGTHSLAHVRAVEGSNITVGMGSADGNDSSRSGATSTTSTEVAAEGSAPKETPMNAHKLSDPVSLPSLFPANTDLANPQETSRPRPPPQPAATQAFPPTLDQQDESELQRQRARALASRRLNLRHFLVKPREHISNREVLLGLLGLLGL